MLKLCIKKWRANKIISLGIGGEMKVKRGGGVQSGPSHTSFKFPQRGLLIRANSKYVIIL